MTEASLVVLGHAVGVVLLSWAYFRRYRIKRPPIGVLNLADVAVMLGAVVVVPFVYLALPTWLVAGLLALGVSSELYFGGEPVLPAGWLTWLVTLGLVGLDLGTALYFGTTTVPFFAVNNLVLTLAIVAIANLWAQSGMTARNAAILGGALTVYDLIFTTQLPVMTDLFQRVAGLPFSPQVGWPVGDGRWLGIGLGDLLLAAAFPLVVRKAFGRSAGLAALGLVLLALTIVLVLSDLELLAGTFPVMLLLGPLMVVQYAYWTHRRGPERTTWQYLEAEPLPS
jgi:hypothetical protein